MVMIIAVVLVQGVVTGALLMVMVMVVVVMVMVIVIVVVIVPRTHEGYPRWSSEA